MRISGWSSDVCSSDLSSTSWNVVFSSRRRRSKVLSVIASRRAVSCLLGSPLGNCPTNASRTFREKRLENRNDRYLTAIKSEEHTSELQSLMRISYAVFCLKKKTYNKKNNIFFKIY